MNHRVSSYTLSRFFADVYKYVGYGLIVAGITSYTTTSLLIGFVARAGVLSYHLLSVFAVFFLQSQVFRAVSRSDVRSAMLWYFAFASLIGFETSVIFLIYAQTSILSIFLLSGVVFLVSAQYGIQTNQDLTGAAGTARFIYIGAFVVSMLAVFMYSLSLMSIATFYIADYLISLAIAVVVPILIASTSQNLAAIYYSNPHQADKVAVIGALELFMYFINLFLSLLRLLGSRRE